MAVQAIRHGHLRYEGALLCSTANALGWSASDLLARQWLWPCLSSETTKRLCVFWIVIGHQAVLTSATERSERCMQFKASSSGTVPLRRGAPPRAEECFASCIAGVRFAVSYRHRGSGSGAPADPLPTLASAFELRLWDFAFSLPETGVPDWSAAEIPLPLLSWTELVVMFV